MSAAPASPAVLAFRSSTGVCVVDGASGYNEVPNSPTAYIKQCRTMLFSPSGDMFAWTTAQGVIVCETVDWSHLLELPIPKTAQMVFSPKATYLATWEPFQTTLENPQGNKNVQIWRLSDGERVSAYVYKKQTEWAPQWSRDESLLSRIVNSEVHFYENGDYSRSTNRLQIHKIGHYALSPGGSPFHIATYVPGNKGQPCFIKVYQYPCLQGPGAAIASKSFFKGDRIEMKWNAHGVAVLILAHTDVDNTGASYYGETNLHYIDVRGESAIVQLEKRGPIYCVEWSPLCKEFAVCYGFMPARVTIYNLKCNPVYDFGEGPRNAIYYNHFGNLVILGGFGNLRGNVEVWDVKGKQMVSKTTAPDSTHLKWDPTGEFYMTCTTAPRLRIGNGYKVWHCSGTLLHKHDWEEKQELFDVAWQNLPKDKLQEKKVTKLNIPSLTIDKKPGQAEIDKIISVIDSKTEKAYVPPHMRNKTNTPAPINTSNMTQDEKDKKIKKLEKKLKDVNMLKARRDRGENLQENQLKKIGT